MASAYQAQQEPKIDQWFRLSFVAIATSMACTEFSRQLLVECHFLDAAICRDLARTEI
jgi:hypothetical protein